MLRVDASCTRPDGRKGRGQKLVDLIFLLVAMGTTTVSSSSNEEYHVAYPRHVSHNVLVYLQYLVARDR